jgi:hypothetical protein
MRDKCRYGRADLVQFLRDMGSLWTDVTLDVRPTRRRVRLARTPAVLGCAGYGAREVIEALSSWTRRQVPQRLEPIRLSHLERTI